MDILWITRVLHLTFQKWISYVQDMNPKDEGKSMSRHGRFPPKINQSDLNVNSIRHNKGSLWYRNFFGKTYTVNTNRRKYRQETFGLAEAGPYFSENKEMIRCEIMLNPRVKNSKPVVTPRRFPWIKLIIIPPSAPTSPPKSNPKIGQSKNKESESPSKQDKYEHPKILKSPVVETGGDLREEC